MALAMEEEATLRGCCMRTLLVETIYEEEEEEEESCTPTPSPLSSSLSSPHTPLRTRVKAWSVSMGRETDVVICVQGSCFHLHKDPLASKSAYLKRQFTELSKLTLSPSFNITVDTFALVADFCYGGHLLLTPFNVAALRTAAELLEMTETRATGGDNLRQKTEAYFRRSIAVNREYASIVLRSCLSLLPHSETTALLVSRCIEALSSTENGDGVISCMDEFKAVPAEDFQLLAESMSRRLTATHDLLYKIVALYLKANDGEITDEQKTRVCNCIDCTMLSPQVLINAVQNPRMPLRFVAQAMFIEQLNTRRSIYSAVTVTDDGHRKHRSKNEVSTLGAMLQRDAEIRQAVQLKTAMEAASSRIRSLEKELSDMRKLLNESENRRVGSSSGRSESFRLVTENKIERGERGSVSSLSLRNINPATGNTTGGYSSSEILSDGSTRGEKNLGRRLMNGLKSAFRVSTSGVKKNSENRISGKENGIADGKSEDVIVIKKNVAFHSHSRSLV